MTRPDDYLVAVEREFTRRRGGAPLLTPADWEVARGWERSGIPLEAALEGIRTALDQSLRPSPRMPLRRCAAPVEAAAAARKRRGAGGVRNPSVEEDRPEPDPVVLLASWRAPPGLAVDPETAGRIEALARAGAAEIRGLREDRSDSRRRAARIETAWAALLDRLVAALPPPVQVELRRAAVAALAGHRERMPERGWRRAVHEAARRRAAGRLGLPSAPPAP